MTIRHQQSPDRGGGDGGATPVEFGLSVGLVATFVVVVVGRFGDFITELFAKAAAAF